MIVQMHNLTQVEFSLVVFKIQLSQGCDKMVQVQRECHTLYYWQPKAQAKIITGNEDCIKITTAV